MEPAHSIATMGFRKWYERQLVEAYAWLVTALLCALVIVLCIELINFDDHMVMWVGSAGAAYVAGLIAVHGTRRFLYLLARAERFGEQSTCGSCRNQAAFDVIREAPRMSVRCLKCAHEWTFH
ncbi:MAG TPA: hypothetical protein VFZ81_00715 [Burkholderiales bacterium]